MVAIQSRALLNLPNIYMHKQSVVRNFLDIMKDSQSGGEHVAEERTQHRL